MKYFVVSDTHGFYDELMEALNKVGFDESNPNHMLISLGDIFDRGPKPYEIYLYYKHLKEINKAILVKGNHEPLMLELLERHEPIHRDFHNKTYESVLELSDKLDGKKERSFSEACDIIIDSSIPKFLDDMIDYYETKDYYFVHGYLPMNEEETEIDPNWKSKNAAWHHARWLHGYEIAVKGIIADKIVVCGHQGSYQYRGLKQNYTKEDFLPIMTKNLIDIDGTTSKSGFVNVLIIEN